MAPLRDTGFLGRAGAGAGAGGLEPPGGGGGAPGLGPGGGPPGAPPGLGPGGGPPGALGPARAATAAGRDLSAVISLFTIFN